MKKVAVHALLDKVNFSRDRYRLGHTVIFYRSVKVVIHVTLSKILHVFQSCYKYLSKLLHVLVIIYRAGALAYLEEIRDELVIKLVRKLQGEVYRIVRGKVYQKKYDQR